MKILNYGIGLLSYGVATYTLLQLKNFREESNILIHVWLKLEVASLFLEPTVLILLAITKPGLTDAEKAKDPEKIVPTYGRVISASSVDYDPHISKKEFKKASKNLKKFNRKLLFMKEDFVMSVAMSYYKRKAEKFSITNAKRGQLFFSCIFSQMITFGMLVCELYAFINNEGGNYITILAQNWPLFGCKFLSAIALHFMLYPEVSDGMTIMKFSIYSFD